VITLAASYDRASNLWMFICDCGYELDLHTYQVMRQWRRMHVSWHLRQGHQVAA